MTLVDAALLVALIDKAQGSKRILTLDRDFYIYRINHTEPFEVIPFGLEVLK
jgi:hypothetical protein